MILPEPPPVKSGVGEGSGVAVGSIVAVAVGSDVSVGSGKDVSVGTAVAVGSGTAVSVSLIDGSVATVDEIGSVCVQAPTVSISNMRNIIFRMWCMFVSLCFGFFKNWILAFFEFFCGIDGLPI